MATVTPPPEKRKKRWLLPLLLLVIAALIAAGSIALIWHSRPQTVTTPAPSIPKPIALPSTVPTVKPTPVKVPDIDSQPDPTSLPTTNGTEEDKVTIDGSTVTHADGSKEDTSTYTPSNSAVKTPQTMKPNRLLISCSNTYAKVQVNRISKGYLNLNNNPFILTQWSGGSTVGASRGNIVLAGHVSYNGVKGALYNLANLQGGCVAYLTDAQGHQEAFKLVDLQEYHKADLPMDKLWNTTGRHQLVLVTCGGKITHTKHGNLYSDNVVATFIPVKVA